MKGGVYFMLLFIIRQFLRINNKQDLPDQIYDNVFKCGFRFSIKVVELLARRTLKKKLGFSSDLKGSQNLVSIENINEKHKNSLISSNHFRILEG